MWHSFNQKAHARLAYSPSWGVPQIPDMSSAIIIAQGGQPERRLKQVIASLVPMAPASQMAEKHNGRDAVSVSNVALFKY